MKNKLHLKKWWLMIRGKSVLHVDQCKGNAFSKSEIAGYYNNLIDKVLLDKEGLSKIDYIPTSLSNNKVKVKFPIAIFQYGLGCYDLFLSTKNPLYLNKFLFCVQWALDNQNSQGGWSTFSYIYPDYPFSAMAQGEGASLLLRAFSKFGLQDYFSTQKRQSIL